VGSDAIDHWPSGERPVYFATADAWRILEIVERDTLSNDARLTLLTPFATRDIRGAYFLTRDRAALARQHVLMSGVDRGQTARGSARILLRRAFERVRLREAAAQMECERESIRAHFKASPPPCVGYRHRSTRRALDLATSRQPLLIRVRKLLELQPGVLRSAAAALRDPASTRVLYPRWPTADEREQVAGILDLALDLLQDLAR